MKNLKDYIKEELATPLDVMGMGNLVMPNLSDTPGELSDQVGSGDTFSTHKKKKEKGQSKRLT